MASLQFCYAHKGFNFFVVNKHVWSRGSLVITVSRLRHISPGFPFTADTEIFIFSTACRVRWGQHGLWNVGTPSQYYTASQVRRLEL